MAGSTGSTRSAAHLLEMAGDTDAALAHYRRGRPARRPTSRSSATSPRRPPGSGRTQRSNRRDRPRIGDGASATIAGDATRPHPGESRRAQARDTLASDRTTSASPSILILLTIIVFAVARGRGRADHQRRAQRRDAAVRAPHGGSAVDGRSGSSAIVVIVGGARAAIARPPRRRRWATATAGFIGLLLAVVAPIVILRGSSRARRSPSGSSLARCRSTSCSGWPTPISSRWSRCSPARRSSSRRRRPTPSDYVYFSYTTLATIGYGDYTAATSLGRMVSVSGGARRAAVPRLGRGAAGRQRRTPAAPRNEPRLTAIARRSSAVELTPSSGTSVTERRSSATRHGHASVARQITRIAQLLRVEAPGSSPGGFFVSGPGLASGRGVRRPAGAGRPAGSRRRGSTRRRSARRAGRWRRTAASVAAAVGSRTR